MGWLGYVMRSKTLTLLLALTCLSSLVNAQPGIDEVTQTIGNRVETLVIIGGDHGLGGGAYTFRGNADANLSVTKLGAGGVVGSRRPLGIGSMYWAPVGEANIGWSSTENNLNTAPLAGNTLLYDTFGVQLGGGARFYFTTNFSLALSVAGIYAPHKKRIRGKHPGRAGFQGPVERGTGGLEAGYLVGGAGRRTTLHMELASHGI
jgi:hypothetical protein